MHNLRSKYLKISEIFLEDIINKKKKDYFRLFIDWIFFTHNLRSLRGQQQFEHRL